MATSDNYLGYNTYILGSTKNVLECLGIILYNKDEFEDIEKISLYNIDQVFDKVVRSNKYLRVNRDTDLDPFLYSHLNNIIPGFDVIIYLSNSNNTPIGYTEFLSIQGSERDINLSLNLVSDIVEGGEINLLNSLSTLKNTTSISKDFTTDDLYNYPSSKVILDDLSRATDIYPRYTTHLSSIKKNNINDNIFLDYGILNKDQFYRLTVSKNININPFEIDFKNYQLGYFENDIVIYSWVDNKYSIYSLIKKNKFKNPITYTDTPKGYREIPSYPLAESQKVNYFSGKYIVIGVEVNGQEEEVLYNIELEDWITTSLPNFVIDQLDVHNEILEYPKILNYSNVFDYFPDIINTHFDLKSFSSSNNINIVKKIGGWYVIRQKRLNNKNILIYTNMSKTLYTLEDDSDMPIIVNDKILFTTSINKEGKKYYSFYTEDNRTYFTENVRSTLFNGKMMFDGNIGAYIFMSNNQIENDNNRLQYSSGAIRIVTVGDDFLKSYLVRYRRNIINENILTVPEFIGAINGLIFYKSQNYLNYI